MGGFLYAFFYRIRIRSYLKCKHFQNEHSEFIEIYRLLLCIDFVVNSKYQLNSGCERVYWKKDDSVSLVVPPSELPGLSLLFLLLVSLQSATFVYQRKKINIFLSDFKTNEIKHTNFQKPFFFSNMWINRLKRGPNDRISVNIDCWIMIKLLHL